METEEEHNSPFDMIMNVMDHFNLNMIIGHVKEDTLDDMITEDEMDEEDENIDLEEVIKTFFVSLDISLTQRVNVHKEGIIVKTGHVVPSLTL